MKFPGITLATLIAPLIIFQVSCSGCSLPFIDAAGTAGSISVVSYNVQNLFDDSSNGNEYYEFDPARGEWTSELYHRKLLSLSELILHSPKGGADILVLQEVENLQTLETLRDHYLKGAGYRYIAVSETPGHAIQQACVSRFPIVSTRIHRTQKGLDTDLRPIMECVVEVEGSPLTLLLNHWKSKSGGAEETERMRIAAARLVRRVIEDIRGREGNREVLILGDLNERSDEFYRVGGEYATALMPHELRSEAAEQIGSLFLTSKREEADGNLSFYSPWLGEETEKPGSYVYNATWEQIDHVLFGPRLYDGGGFEYTSFSVAAPEFILNSEGYPLAFSRTSGTGYSDHLPILIELSLE